MGDILKNCRRTFSPEQPHWVIKTQGNRFTGGADISLFNGTDPKEPLTYLSLHIFSNVCNHHQVYTNVTLYELMQMRAMCDEAIAFMTTRKGNSNV